jgi:hypothetical protein
MSLCQKNKLRRELKEQKAKENHRARKPTSLSARRSTTSEGKHSARSTKQAIAIALSKARRAGKTGPAEKGQSFRIDPAQRRARLPGESQKKVTLV